MFPDLIGKDQIKAPFLARFGIFERPLTDVIFGIAKLFITLEVEHFAPFARHLCDLKLLWSKRLDHPAAGRLHDDTVDADHLV